MPRTDRPAAAMPGASPARAVIHRIAAAATAAPIWGAIRTTSLRVTRATASDARSSLPASRSLSSRSVRAIRSRSGAMAMRSIIAIEIAARRRRSRSCRARRPIARASMTTSEKRIGAPAASARRGSSIHRTRAAPGNTTAAESSFGKPRPNHSRAAERSPTNRSDSAPRRRSATARRSIPAI